jgi:hypothetical protein
VTVEACRCGRGTFDPTHFASNEQRRCAACAAEMRAFQDEMHGRTQLRADLKAARAELEANRLELEQLRGGNVVGELRRIADALQARQ